MVKPLVIKISAELVGLSQIILPQFSGYDVMVSRRGLGELDDGELDLANKEYDSLPNGGFALTDGATFTLNERYTVTPLPNLVVFDPSAPVYPVFQYPHILSLTTIATSAQDGQGNWVAGAATITQRPCRQEPSSGGRYLVGAGGMKIYYDFVLYMPLPSETIAAGTKAEVYDQENSLLVSGTIKRFNKGQLNARAWV
ncbi:MAG TPA: hypothetical protein VGM31_14270 [Puia sp.]|jgi:hypothetical protein